jgi:hypothetical protein
LIKVEVSLLSIESEKILGRLRTAAKDESCTLITPPTLKGKSGVMHGFSFLASDGEKFYGADILEPISQIDAMKARIKQYDTGAFCCMVSPTGKPGTDVKKNGSQFGIGIFGSDEVEELVNALKGAFESTANREGP